VGGVGFQRHTDDADDQGAGANAAVVVGDRYDHGVTAGIGIHVVERERLVRVQDHGLGTGAVAEVDGGGPGVGVGVAEGAGVVQ
jgi:hypothetical protein